MRYINVIVSILFLGTTISAQTIEQIDKQIERNNAIIRAYQHCFHENFSNPKPHKETYTLSSGKVVCAMAQSDFIRSEFITFDEFINDLRLWRDSPYLWQLKHKKEGKSLMDAKDLSKLEVQFFDQIAQDFFSAGENTFHIAAHGLVDQNHAPANMIKIGGQELNAEETAELILKSMHDQYHNVLNASNKPFVIVLHCCHSAEGENNLCKELSKILGEQINNLYVVGAPDRVYWDLRYDSQPGEKPKMISYDEYVSDKEDGKRIFPLKKNWKVYNNGKDINMGEESFKDTVREIQRTY